MNIKHLIENYVSKELDIPIELRTDELKYLTDPENGRNLATYYIAYTKMDIPEYLITNDLNKF
jgi:hypothetical protein